MTTQPLNSKPVNSYTPIRKDLPLNQSPCADSGPRDHVVQPRRQGEESFAFERRRLNDLKDFSRAGHSVQITPTRLGIERGIGNEESRELAEAGVKVVLDRDDVERAESTDGLQQLVANGVDVRYYQPYTVRHEKMLTVDGWNLL